MLDDQIKWVKKNKAPSLVIAVLLAFIVLGPAAYFVGPVSQASLGQERFEGFASEDAARSSFMPPNPGSGASVDELLASDRQVIKTGSLDLEVSDAESTQASIKSLAGKFNGFVTSSNVFDRQGIREGRASIRVPSNSFDAAFNDLKALGKVESESTNARDVTEEFIDLEKRLSVMRAEEQALISLLERAESVEDVLKVREQLRQVRSEIESLQGRLNYLETQTTLSTISVSFSEPTPLGKDFDSDVFGRAVRAFTESVEGIILFIGVWLPWALFAALAYWAYKAFSKKKFFKK